MNIITNRIPNQESPIAIMGPEGVIVIPMRHTWVRYDLGFLASLNIAPQSFR